MRGEKLGGIHLARLENDCDILSPTQLNEDCDQTQLRHDNIELGDWQH